MGYALSLLSVIVVLSLGLFLFTEFTPDDAQPQPIVIETEDENPEIKQSGGTNQLD